MKNAKRKALIDSYKANHPECAVYRIINEATGAYELFATLDIHGIQNRIAFGRKMGGNNIFPGGDRPNLEMGKYGQEHFKLEILEAFVPKPEQQRPDILAELQLLQALWQEKLADEEA